MFFCASETLKTFFLVEKLLTSRKVSGSKMNLFVHLGGQNWKFSLSTFKNSGEKHKNNRQVSERSTVPTLGFDNISIVIE